jgi:hypothetical protein
MTQEAFFEELEQQFVAENPCSELKQQLSRCTTLHLLVGNRSFQLLAPILGADFVVGFDVQTGAWMCFAKSRLLIMRFARDAEAHMPKLRIRATCLEQFLQELSLPTAAEFKPIGQPGFSAALIRVESDLAFFREPDKLASISAVSISSLEWLAIFESSDARELSDWRER